MTIGGRAGGGAFGMTEPALTLVTVRGGVDERELRGICLRVVIRFDHAVVGDRLVDRRDPRVDLKVLRVDAGWKCRPAEACLLLRRPRRGL